ncbi:hypothetical protein QMO56_18040 [Roseomonas sp. E05]|uniref:hypothetical protein n=1 Tax=Roseomonas sp. E05 TaxID=3046310 RepID=UPI0024BBAE9C|nr:hypothetical protein [Roseomonas sp. E05]MDJ0390012.1 hypothetical protein [Roseomonas sp. E05]
MLQLWLPPEARPGICGAAHPSGLVAEFCRLHQAPQRCGAFPGLWKGWQTIVACQSHPAEVAEEAWALAASPLGLLSERAGQREHALFPVLNGLP